MADNLTKERRSYLMSRIRSKWTSQEKKLHGLLKGLKIRHKMHPVLSGSPDILIKNNDLVVFLHGCFWHKCSKCYRPPKSNRAYWLPKIEKNVQRDRRNIRLLKKQGFKVIVLWEHELKKNLDKAVRKLLSY